jgi:hypothetical protein
LSAARACDNGDTTSASARDNAKAREDETVKKFGEAGEVARRTLPKYSLS